MTRRHHAFLPAGLLLGLGMLTAMLTGCKVGTDDELAPRPTRTVTASPDQTVAPAPATIPVGRGAVSPADAVWAQGSVLHVGDRRVDLAPIRVDALAVVQGGVFVLADGELWFTDLSRVRGTGQTRVTGLRTSADARHLEVVDTRSGRPLGQGYDTRTGHAVTGEVRVQTPAQKRAGPGAFEVRTDGRGAVVIDTRTGREVPVSGVGRGFELGGWSGPTQFEGVTGAGGERSVVSCDVTRGRCRTVGAVSGPDPVVFATGT